MAKPQYRLQVLLEMKEKAEEQAKEAFGRSQKVLADEEKKLRELHEELARMIEHRKAKRAEYDGKLVKGQLKPQQVPQVKQFIEKLIEQEVAFQETIKQQEERVAEARRAVEKAQEALIEATKEKKAMDKHKETFMKQALKEIADKEADAQDELGQSIFMGRRNS